MAAPTEMSFAFYAQAPPQLYDDAVGLLLLDRGGEAANVLTALTRPDSLTANPLDSLSVLECDGRTAAALFSRIQPGRTALLWPPRCRSDAPPETATRLLNHVLGHLREAGVQIVQALPEPNVPADEAALLAAGFQHVTDLLYLVWVDQLPFTSPPQTDLQFEPYSQANHARLCRVVEQSYEGTRDCPELNGTRGIEDVLAGYRAAGRFDAAQWLIVRHGGSDVGCLLLTSHPEANQWELVYLGLIPSARGAGLGTTIVRQAQWLSHQAGARQLVLAVDANNAPAIKLYATAGFVAWDRRAIYLKIFTSVRG